MLPPRLATSPMERRTATNECCMVKYVNATPPLKSPLIYLSSSQSRGDCCQSMLHTSHLAVTHKMRCFTSSVASKWRTTTVINRHTLPD